MDGLWNVYYVNDRMVGTVAVDGDAMVFRTPMGKIQEHRLRRTPDGFKHNRADDKRTWITMGGARDRVVWRCDFRTLVWKRAYRRVGLRMRNHSISISDLDAVVSASTRDADAHEATATMMKNRAAEALEHVRAAHKDRLEAAMAALA
jgi:hypothetical protein